MAEGEAEATGEGGGTDVVDGSTVGEGELDGLTVGEGVPLFTTLVLSGGMKGRSDEQAALTVATTAKASVASTGASRGERNLVDGKMVAPLHHARGTSCDH